MTEYKYTPHFSDFRSFSFHTQFTNALLCFGLSSKTLTKHETEITFIFLQPTDLFEDGLQVHVEPVAVAEQLQEVARAQGAACVVYELTSRGQTVGKDFKLFPLREDEKGEEKVSGLKMSGGRKREKKPRDAKQQAETAVLMIVQERTSWLHAWKN